VAVEAIALAESLPGRLKTVLLDKALDRPDPLAAVLVAQVVETGRVDPGVVIVTADAIPTSFTG